MKRYLFNMCYSMFYCALKSVMRYFLLSLLRRFNRHICCFFYPLSFKSRYGTHLNTKLLCKEIKFYNVTVFLDYIHHIYSAHHRNPQFTELCCKVQIPFDIGSVYNIQYGVGTLIYQVIPRHYFFESVWRERIYSGKIRYNNIFMIPDPSLFLFNCYTRPVSHILCRTCKCIE